jgi:cohesin loading factor subunit SCC2
MYFLRVNSVDIRRETLTAIGYFGVKNCEFLTQRELKDLYQDMLVNKSVQTDMKITVLKNILWFLAEEEQKMVRNDKDCKWCVDFQL